MNHHPHCHDTPTQLTFNWSTVCDRARGDKVLCRLQQRLRFNRRSITSSSRVSGRDMQCSTRSPVVLNHARTEGESRPREARRAQSVTSPNAFFIARTTPSYSIVDYDVILQIRSQSSTISDLFLALYEHPRAQSTQPLECTTHKTRASRSACDSHMTCCVHSHSVVCGEMDS